jgi:hypothetical protein
MRKIIFVIYEGLNFIAEMRKYNCTLFSLPSERNIIGETPCRGIAVLESNRSSELEKIKRHVRKKF